MKKRFQDVRFSSVDEFLDYLPVGERRLVQKLRNIVFDCIPNVKEKLSYNVPFYSRRKTICFIWPPSVKWGNTVQPGTRFGFSQGYRLHDEWNYLEKSTRKQVYWKEFGPFSDKDEEILRALLLEAVMLDTI